MISCLTKARSNQILLTKNKYLNLELKNTKGLEDLLINKTEIEKKKSLSEAKTSYIDGEIRETLPKPVLESNPIERRTYLKPQKKKFFFLLRASALLFIIYI